MCAARCVLRACNATLVCAGQAGRPIRTRACAVATAGPAKPVTHAAPRHQHQPPGHRLQHQTGSQRAYRSDGNTIVRPTVRPSVRPFVRSSVRSSVPPFPHRRAFTSTFLLFLAQRPFFSLSLSLPSPAALTSSPREYARSSNRAYCRGYTPIDPEVSSNGQLENRLGFPRSCPAISLPFGSFAGYIDTRTLWSVILFSGIFIFSFRFIKMYTQNLTRN